MQQPLVNTNKTVTISEPATVAQAARNRDWLATAVLEASRLDIAVEADEVDVTLIQLLVAARRSIEARGGTLALTSMSGALRKALAQGGFVDHADADALWTLEVTP